MIGLLEASRNYDPTQGASFETYAGIRIRGAMLDEIRKTDWTPRSVHRKARQVAEAVREIENAQGRDARDNEVAESLGICWTNITAFCRTPAVAACSASTTPTWSAMPPTNWPPNSRTSRLRICRTRISSAPWREAIAGLPERERLVMSLYYDQELNLREIGAVLGVSANRGSARSTARH